MFSVPGHSTTQHDAGHQGVDMQRHRGPAQGDDLVGFGCGLDGGLLVRRDAAYHGVLITGLFSAFGEIMVEAVAQRAQWFDPAGAAADRHGWVSPAGPTRFSVVLREPDEDLRGRQLACLADWFALRRPLSVVFSVDEQEIALLDRASGVRVGMRMGAAAMDRG